MHREKERDHTGMWTMDPRRSRKLRPLFHTTLRPQTTLANSMVAAAFSSCRLAHSHRAQPMEVALLPLRSQYYWTAARMGLMEEQVRREGSRWNPTKEQLRALEELYARGTRTPPAHQIQLIAAQLRRYGRIEGKNVFYWFQNHKARERQRLRRQAEEAAATAASPSDHKQDSGGAAPAAGSGVLEQESKSWGPDKSCTSASLQATSAAAGGRGEETAYSPWLLLHRQSWAEGDAAWQDTSRNPQPRLPRPAATSSSGSGGSSNHSNLELSRGRRTLAREFAEGEEPTTTLDLFPLRSGNDLLGSSSPGNKPRTSPHVRYFQFL